MKINNHLIIERNIQNKTVRKHQKKKTKQRHPSVHAWSLDSIFLEEYRIVYF